VARTDTTAKVGIGGLCVKVASRRAGIIAHVAERYWPFVCDESPDFTVEMALEEDESPAEFLDVPAAALVEFLRRGLTVPHDSWLHGLPQSRGAPTDRPRVEGDRLESRPDISRIGRLVLFQRRDFAGWVDIDAGRGKCVMGRNMEPFAVESFLRVSYSFLAVANGGLLLHSAGVIRDGQGFLFPGVSGTGKSTIASLVTSREIVLSDELIMVTNTDGDYQVHSTPFHGTNEAPEENRHAPLKAAFLPVKDTQSYVAEAKPRRALAKLLGSILFFGQESASTQRLMDIGADLVAQVPFYEMHFRRDNSFWDCIGELNGAGG
jgi:hypothetical protein